MRKMANAFNCTVAELENELMPLILDGQIQARIDSQNKASCCIAYLCCNRTASDATNVWTICTCLEVSSDPMLWISMNSCPLNLLLVRSHQILSNDVAT